MERQMEMLITSHLRKEVSRLKSDFANEMLKGNIKRNEVEKIVSSKIDRTEFDRQLNLKSNTRDMKS
jgi:hypothetical protein